ncbi:Uncharacterised protein [[Clostridium] sordellii]|uniref:hypothetical protein n=2 Tax=Peptostreptococcaceae TaxID=186804 RepID=UPI0005E2D560|nr:hypothetical protein [Paeniclostridium sordellii]CEN25157.1 Uncharacterised protein [[Clostridium] sordellii] [Paeniclostridium sordellii]
MKKGKFKIYERVWNLSNEDEKELKKVGLEKGTYKYIGKASINTYLSNRESCWKYKYKNKKLPKKVQSFMEKLDNLYTIKGLYKEERYRLMFNNCNVIDYAQDEKELSLKEMIYITRVDVVSKFIDGLIVEEPIILLNRNSSMAKVKENKGMKATLIETPKVS